MCENESSWMQENEGGLSFDPVVEIHVIRYQYVKAMCHITEALRQTRHHTSAFDNYYCGFCCIMP